MNAAGFEASVRQLYCEFLQGMFAASGKTRKKFYRDMLAEVEIEPNLLSVEYSDQARAFYGRILGSVHKDHLLVFYSVGLLLKTMKMAYRKDTPFPKKELEVLYNYFEENLPLRGKFLRYSRDDSFFISGIEKGTLSEL